ncbi:MAG: ornithine cyclodeaminase family protein [Actinomycetota bacterium]
MRIVDEAGTRAATPWPDLIDAIGAMLAGGAGRAPDRHVHPIGLPGGADGALLLMPSWVDGDVLGVKTVTYVPTNQGTDVPTVNASYQLFDGTDGRLVAVIDGDELTARRTAAISALAARSLARPDAANLLVMGTGQVAPNAARAYATVRPITRIEVWGRNPDAAARTAAELAAEGLPASPTGDPERSAGEADIVTCATGATAPIVNGAWLRPGTHLDLIGSFQDDMRESDDEAVGQATVFVDSMAGALLAGDLAQPIRDGVLAREAIAGDLRDLVTGAHPGRRDDAERTVFKSAGFALADLAAARLVLASTAPPTA